MARRLPVLALAALLAGAVAAPVAAQEPEPAPEPAFGDDSSPWARDGECDDRRFAGPGMAGSLGWADAGRDAADCRALWAAGAVRPWDPAAARAATECDAVEFGDDGGEGAGDGVCGDMRFEGLGMAAAVDGAEQGRDAADCARLCALGAIAVRDY